MSVRLTATEITMNILINLYGRFAGNSNNPDASCQ